MGSKYTKRFTEVFKRDAIALVDSSGKTVTAAGTSLVFRLQAARGHIAHLRDQGVATTS